MSFGYGDVFDAVGDAVQPDDPAILCDGDMITWSQFSTATNALARAFLAAGLSAGAKVAEYMRNGPAYPIVFVAAMKARLAPVNVNYRYGPDELAYLLDNCDAEVVAFDAEFADNARAIRPRLPGVKLWLSAGARVEGFDFLDDLTNGDGTKLDIQRSPDDLFLLYTGGTTGMPKGVDVAEPCVVGGAGSWPRAVSRHGAARNAGRAPGAGPQQGRSRAPSMSPRP